jgi:hypothetical protein
VRFDWNKSNLGKSIVNVPGLYSNRAQGSIVERIGNSEAIDAKSLLKDAVVHLTQFRWKLD